MTRSSPRNSLKKHDAAASSRASKARRDRTTTQIRKDKRRETVQSKRRRLLSSDDIALSGRDITELVAILSGTNGDATSHTDQYEVLQEIRALLAANEHDYEAVERVIESGIVPVLVSLLDAASPLSSSTRAGGDVYKEVLWCLTNIASGQYAHTKLVLPAVPRLLQFVEGANTTLAEHAAWVLGNIAADCDEFRQQLIANGAVQPLVARLAHAHVEPKLAQTCAWALSNLARGHATSAKPFVDAGIVPVVTAGLPQGQPHAFSQEIIVEVAWLLSCLTAREEEYLKLWLEHGLVELLLPYFATSDELLLTPILRVMGNICCGASDHHTDAWQLPFVERLLQAEDALFLRKLQEFLQPDVAAAHAHLAAEAAWVLSNLATHDVRIVTLILPFLPLLAQHFHDVGRFEVRREVAFALANVALTSATHLEMVMQLDVLPGFLQLLSAADVAVVGNSLRLIENVLRVAPNGVSLVESHDGIEALENVQYQSQETHLATWAEAIVNEFYGEQYGINSPPSASAVGGNVPTFNFELPPPAEPTADSAAPGGRGRGAHMTVPAWKK